MHVFDFIKYSDNKDGFSVTGHTNMWTLILILLIVCMYFVRIND